jgi:rifampicin phosphotransferase
VILTGPEIARQRELRRICIEPFNPEHVNPNSYNFTLGSTLKRYREELLDPHVVNDCDEIEIGPDGYVLQSNCLYLAHTCERMGSDFFAPTFAARSSVARLGLFINLSASLGDIGFCGQWTLQLFPIHQLRVYAGMRIGQMMWWRPQGEILLYEGKYQGSDGPTSTLIHRDFELLTPAASGGNGTSRMAGIGAR